MHHPFAPWEGIGDCAGIMEGRTASLLIYSVEMSWGLVDILMPPSLAVVFLAFAWVSGRFVRGAKPFTPFMRGLTVYGTLYVIGMGYIVLVVAKLHLAEWLYIALPAAWALVLGFIAWLRRSSIPHERAGS